MTQNTPGDAPGREARYVAKATALGARVSQAKLFVLLCSGLLCNSATNNSLFFKRSHFPLVNRHLECNFDFFVLF